MALTITVPDRYPWVLLVSVGAGWLTVWQTSIVGRYRKRAQIAYPQVYAEKAEAQASKDAQKFNCAQRAHQNTLEFLPQLLVSLLIGGLRFPEVSAGLGAVWLFGRVLFTQGYATGDPNKRRRGTFSLSAAAALLATATYAVGEWVYQRF